MTKKKEKENVKFDRREVLILLFFLLPLLIIAVVLFPSIEIALGLWGGFTLIVLGCHSFKHSIFSGEYGIYHWSGKRARFWAMFNIIVGIMIMSCVLYFNYFYK